jgi:hypothetical protein
MFTSNPFADLTVFLSPLVMQVYIILMILAVAGGTLFDMLHKSSAKFFVRQWKKSKAAATQRLSSTDTASLAVLTLLKEVATSGEFHNPRRRISHLLMFYGFLLYLIATIVMVFCYPTEATTTPVIWPILWNAGAAMILIGGYWFFFFIRVDVAKEGHSPFRLVRADIFIVSLLTSVTFAFIWEIVQATGGLAATKIAFGLYIIFTTLLFVSVPWSKFAHMFYKPAAAFQRRVEEADGSSDLPTPTGSNHGR